jgi:hypothetical protein
LNSHAVLKCDLPFPDPLHNLSVCVIFPLVLRGAYFHPDYFICLVGLGGEHENWDGHLFTQGAAHLEACGDSRVSLDLRMLMFIIAHQPYLALGLFMHYSKALTKSWHVVTQPKTSVTFQIVASWVNSGPILPQPSLIRMGKYS